MTSDASLTEIDEAVYDKFRSESNKSAFLRKSSPQLVAGLLCRAMERLSERMQGGQAEVEQELAVS
jgi:hypothetical protein